jgi:hypothetical protein
MCGASLVGRRIDIASGVNVCAVLALVLIGEGLMWTGVAVSAYREYCTIVEHGVDPFRALATMMTTVVILMCYEVSFGTATSFELVTVGLRAIASAGSALSLEQAVYYSTLLQEVNARSKQRPELAFHFVTCLLILACTVAPTCFGALTAGSHKVRAGVLACAALLFAAHVRVWGWMDGRTTYIRLQMTTLATLALAKAIFLWSFS